MATNYPTSLDTATEQPSPSQTTDLAAAGYEHDTVHTNHSEALIALETKLGIGVSAASGASDGDALTKQADGSTAWEAVSSGVSWSGSTANGLATYGGASTIVAESTATYDGTTLTLTQSGGGVNMDGLNSSDANTLDDYEEGTWTIVASVGGGTLTVNTSYNTGKYTKIGNRVFISGACHFSTVSSPTGSLNFTGLPFANSNTGQSVQEKRAWGLASSLDLVSDIDSGGALGWCEAAASQITMYVEGRSALGGFDPALLDTGSTVLFHGHYTTDS